MRKRKSSVAALILLLLCGPLGLSGCVFLPKGVEDHVDSCDSDTFPLTVELIMEPVGSCDAYCGAFLLMVGAATLTVSTVVVLVGNTAYAIDKHVRCDSSPTAPVNPESAGPASVQNSPEESAVEELYGY